jgi:hypothetical protein
LPTKDTRITTIVISYHVSAVNSIITAASFESLKSILCEFTDGRADSVITSAALCSDSFVTGALFNNVIIISSMNELFHYLISSYDVIFTGASPELHDFYGVLSKDLVVAFITLYPENFACSTSAIDVKTSDEQVISFATDKHVTVFCIVVSLRTTKDGIVAVVALKVVVSRATQDVVIPGATGNVVIIGTTLNVVVATSSFDCIVARTTIKFIVV